MTEPQNEAYGTYDEAGQLILTDSYGKPLKEQPAPRMIKEPEPDPQPEPESKKRGKHDDCREHMNEIMAAASKVSTPAQRKQVDFDKQGNFYGPDGFTTTCKNTCCMWAIKAEGYEQWMKTQEIEA